MVILGDRLELWASVVVIELVVLSKLKNWYFGGVMLSDDIIINHSQVIDQGPSALLFYINYLTGGL